MSNNIKVTILLATYNGARFIREQLTSIVQQTYSRWELLVSDDASNDDTRLIVNEYAMLYKQITILPPAGSNLGSVANFSRLFDAAILAGAGYIMFCDQDDYWLPFKIEQTLSNMLAQEARKGSASPLLLHTNFTYVEADLKPIAAKANFHARKLRRLGLANLVVQNPVYGCTCMFNKALVNKIRYIPAYAENHDYWVALAASAFGEIVYLPQSTMLYRQHGANISTQHDDNRMSNRIRRVLAKKSNVKNIEQKRTMIGGFAGIYAGELSLQQEELIWQFLIFLKDRTPASAIASLRRGVRLQTAGQTALFYLMALLHR